MFTSTLLKSVKNLLKPVALTSVVLFAGIIVKDPVYALYTQLDMSSPHHILHISQPARF